MHPYRALPAHCFWRQTVAKNGIEALRELYAPRFAITREHHIATAGSCFAQHVARHLRGRGYAYLDLEPAPVFLSPDRRSAYGYELFSARYGNVYTTRQLRQLFERATGHFVPEIDHWEVGGRFFDPFRPTIEPGGFGSLEELRALRAAHFRAVVALIRRADVFVFTLGLTEMWEDRDGAAYPLCPGTAAGEFDASRHRFVNLSVQDVVKDMGICIRRFRRMNPGMEFILTVSPVPLAATATGDHVVQATAYSKAVLRAAAGALVAEHEGVDYFPSFEIVTSPAAQGAFYADDMRQVAEEGVEFVMGSFFAAHGDAGDLPPVMIDVADEGGRDRIDPMVVCDEELLGAMR